MRKLVETIKNPIILKIKMILGAVIMTAAMLLLPGYLAYSDITLLTEPSVLGVVIAGMLFFGLVGYFRSVRPYFLYCKAPAVQVEADDEFLYIHGKKEEKIALAEISEAYVHVSLPHMFANDFLSEFLIHLVSDQYGDLYLDLPGFGEFRMRFVSNVENTSKELIGFIQEKIDGEKLSQ